MPSSSRRDRRNRQKNVEKANARLYTSVQSDDFCGVVDAIRDGADVNCKKDGVAVLTTAIEHNHTFIACYLLCYSNIEIGHYDPDVSTDQYASPINMAIAKKSWVLVRMIEYGACITIWPADEPFIDISMPNDIDNSHTIAGSHINIRDMQLLDDDNRFNIVCGVLKLESKRKNYREYKARSMAISPFREFNRYNTIVVNDRVIISLSPTDKLELIQKYVNKDPSILKCLMAIDKRLLDEPIITLLQNMASEYSDNTVEELTNLPVPNIECNDTIENG
jgi:hypothetical protein